MTVISATKKPVEIEAIQFIVTKEIQCKFGVATEDNAMEICKFMGLTMLNVPTDKDGKYLNIPTKEGIMRASIGDYIIKEPFDKERGFYPCKPDVFALTYDIN